MNKQRTKQPDLRQFPTPRWYGIQAVAERYGVSDTEIRRQVRKGTFPRPVYMGQRLARWNSEQLAAYDARLLSQLDQRKVA